MKKIIMTLFVMFVSVVSSFAGDIYKVRYVNINTRNMSVSCICDNFEFLINRNWNFAFRPFFSSLRSGDVIEVERTPEGVILGARKVGHEAPAYQCNGGVVIDGNAAGNGWYTGGYGYTGSAHVGYTSKDGRTNVGVGTYSNGDGSSTVVVGGSVKGFHFNVPVTVKKKSTRRTTPTTTTATTTTTTRTAPKTVQTTTSTSTTTSAAVLYNASTLTEMF